MVKEKGFNPVQAQRKADKAKEIKKGKAEVQARRNERLARRNPEGIQRQVDELKKITEGGGKLTRHEEQVLEGLEKELKAVVKAREALGDRAPQFNNSRGPPRDGSALGKRRRGDGGDDDDYEAAAAAGGRRRRGRESDSDSDEVPDDVRAIPMPRDTPPPIPKEVLDRWWARRRAKRGGGGGGGRGGGAGSSANAEPLANDRGLGGGGGGGGGEDDRAAQRPAAAAEPKVVYEAKPVVRNLLKEATSAFVPAAVASKLAMGRGEGGRLMEPEEADRLESEGYMKTAAPAADEEQATSRLHQVTLEEVADEDEGR